MTNAHKWADPAWKAWAMRGLPHLTPEQVRQARDLRRRGEKLATIAAEVGCSVRAVSRATAGPCERNR